MQLLEKWRGPGALWANYEAAALEIKSRKFVPAVCTVYCAQ